MNKISGVLVVYNEEDNISCCIESIGFCDEIIVVDTDSTDSTVSIAESHGCRVINSEVPYPEYKKNIGIEQAKHDWVFVIDADERATPELREEIGEVMRDPKSDAYGVYRQNFFFGREIKHCGWENDRVVRLFRKKIARYPAQLVHGVLQVDGKESDLKGRLEHHSYRKVSDYLRKVDKYTLWSATDRKKKTGPLKVILNPVFRFKKMYILKLGFLDGTYGFALCFMASFSVFLKYFRMYIGETLDKR